MGDCYYEGHAVDAPGACARCGRHFVPFSWWVQMVDVLTLGPWLFRLRRAAWRRW
jgi:hypothetical protein